jgi:hypothetical protein
MNSETLHQKQTPEHCIFLRMRGMEHGLMIHVSVFLVTAAVGSIDTSGTSMLDELKKKLERRGMQVRAKAVTPRLVLNLKRALRCHGMNLG